MVLKAKNIDPDQVTKKEVADPMKALQEKYLSVTFLHGSDHLENDYTQLQDRYPKTVTAAYSLLMNWKQDPRSFMRILGPIKDGVSFTKIDDKELLLNTNGQNTGGAHKRDKSHITCHKCGIKGHYATA